MGMIPVRAKCNRRIHMNPSDEECTCIGSWRRSSSYRLVHNYEPQSAPLLSLSICISIDWDPSLVSTEMWQRLKTSNYPHQYVYHYVDSIIYDGMFMIVQVPEPILSTDMDTHTFRTWNGWNKDVVVMVVMVVLVSLWERSRSPRSYRSMETWYSVDREHTVGGGTCEIRVSITSGTSIYIYIYVWVWV
jgi:hypothetical protein